MESGTCARVDQLSFAFGSAPPYRAAGGDRSRSERRRPPSRRRHRSTAGDPGSGPGPLQRCTDCKDPPGARASPMATDASPRYRNQPSSPRRLRRPTSSSGSGSWSTTSRTGLQLGSEYVATKVAVCLVLVSAISSTATGTEALHRQTPQSGSDCIEHLAFRGWLHRAPYPGEVCLNIRGSGLHVDWTKVILRSIPSTSNYRAAVRFTRPNGVVTSFTSGTHAGCSYGAAYITFYASAGNYPHGTRVCGYWYDSTASPRGGRPCLYIRR